LSKVSATTFPLIYRLVWLIRAADFIAADGGNLLHQRHGRWQDTAFDRRRWLDDSRLAATPEFVRLYNEAVASHRKKSTETFSSLIDYFKDQSEYKSLSDKSTRAYDGYLKRIEAKFGAMPVGAVEDRRARGDFKDFRDSFSDTPRKADYVWTTIARVLEGLAAPSLALPLGAWRSRAAVSSF
jgi:hypothetical protein